MSKKLVKKTSMLKLINGVEKKYYRKKVKVVTDILINILFINKIRIKIFRSRNFLIRGKVKI